MKKLLLAVSAVASALYLGATEYSAVTFSTVGPDKYADGTTVLDGECYALVYSIGEFAGFNYDGTVKDSANSKLLVALPLAEGGKCKPVVFNIEDGIIPANATLGVYLLDTRAFVNGVATVQGVDATGKIKQLNASEAVAANLTVSGKTGTAPVASTASTAAGTSAVASALPADVPNPVITKMEISGENAVLTVKDTIEGVNYEVIGGASPADKDPLDVVNVGGADEMTFVVPKEKANFFRIKRK